MISTIEYVANCLDRMRHGDGADAENAYFSLIEANPVVVPILIGAFAQDENHEIRAKIAKCIWLHRRPVDIGFLSELLYDSDKAVWQEALDGLVTIGGNEAVQALKKGPGSDLSSGTGKSPDGTLGGVGR